MLCNFFVTRKLNSVKPPPGESEELLSQNTPALPGSMGCPCSGGRAISSAQTGAAQVPVPLLEAWEMAGETRMNTARSFLLPLHALPALPAFCGQQLEVFLAKAGMWTIIFAPYPQIFWPLSNLPNCSEAISTFSFYSLQWLFQVSWRFYEGVLFILAFMSSYLDLH